ncbi:FimD/PapC C-terminal domain-containing protein, partial [Pseudomonas protegens]
IPFGAMARDQDGKNLGVVDNLSRLLAFGIKDSGQLKVEWKDGACLADYTLPQRDKENAYDRIKTVCRDQNM